LEKKEQREGERSFWKQRKEEEKREETKKRMSSPLSQSNEDGRSKKLKDSHTVSTASSKLLQPPAAAGGGKKRRGSMPAAPGEWRGMADSPHRPLSPSELREDRSSLTPPPHFDSPISPGNKKKSPFKRNLKKLASPLAGGNRGGSVSEIDPLLLEGGSGYSPNLNNRLSPKPSSSASSVSLRTSPNTLKGHHSMSDTSKSSRSNSLSMSAKTPAAVLSVPSTSSSSSSATSPFFSPFRSPSLFNSKSSEEMSLPARALPCYGPNEVQEMLAYLMTIYSSNSKYSKEEIDNFLAAFSNFDISMETLFEVICTCLNDMPAAPDSFSSSEDAANKASAGEALRYILTSWFKQSGAVYEKQHPKFFRTVASFVGSSKDPRINPLKLMILRNNFDSHEDTSKPFYRSIIEQTKQMKELPPDDVLFTTKLFKQFPVKEIADSVTYVMFNIYSNIGPSELHDGSWQGEDRPIRAPHLHLLSVVFNHLAFLCNVDILFAKNDDDRADVLSKVIELGKIFRKNGNYEGMAAVGGVLGGSSIARLKKAWSALDSKSVKQAKKLEEIVAGLKNYKVYKELAKSTSGPYLPWIAPKLTELRFLYDGNSKVDDDGNIDYTFLQQAGYSINNYLQFNQTKISALGLSESQEIIAILEDVTLFDVNIVDDKLYEQSLKVQPLK